MEAVPTVRSRIIVNADDFGFSVGITDGILKAARDGILTSATIMATMPDFDRAVALAKDLPTLDVGVHLCLTQGLPRTRLKALAADGGSFPRSIPALVKRLCLKRGAVAEAEAEWSAQVERLLDAGIKPTHLDSHKHIHHLPMLQGAALRVALRYGVPAIRCARELPLPGLAMSPAYHGLARLARGLARRVEDRGLATTDWFFGLAATGRTDGPTLLRLAAAAPPGLGEIMVHPGHPDGLDAGDTRLLRERMLELESLCLPAVRAAFGAAHIRLGTYADLGPAAAGNDPPTL